MEKTNKSRIHKYKADFRAGDFYYIYKSERHNGEVTQKEYTKILKMFFNIVLRKMILDLFKFNFPGLGYFYIIKRKQVHKVDSDGKLKVDAVVNWIATNKLQKKTGDKSKFVYYLNEHTFNNIYRFKWDKTKYHFVNKKFYSFSRSRNAKQILFKYIKSNLKPLNAYMQ